MSQVAHPWLQTLGGGSGIRAESLSVDAPFVRFQTLRDRVGERTRARLAYFPWSSAAVVGIALTACLGAIGVASLHREASAETRSSRLSFELPREPGNASDFLSRVDVIQRGAFGSDVVRIQGMLETVGFAPGSVDGEFGAGTEEAVAAFQKSVKIRADGIVGPATWEALDRSVRRAERRASRPDTFVESARLVPVPSG
jgi:hypothetical protein